MRRTEPWRSEEPRPLGAREGVRPGAGNGGAARADRLSISLAAAARPSLGDPGAAEDGGSDGDPAVQLGAGLERALAERRTAIEKELQSLVPRDAELAGIATRVSVVESSDVGRALCQVARRVGADAICLASHGRSGLREKVLGSVAHDVLTRADMPVFVVHVSPE